MTGSELPKTTSARRTPSVSISSGSANTSPGAELGAARHYSWARTAIACEETENSRSMVAWLGMVKRPQMRFASGIGTLL